jgi:hypothetical protein
VHTGARLYDFLNKVDDVANDDSDDDLEFTNDEDGFLMMTPAVTVCQKIADESAATNVSFTCSMLNMFGDRMHNVPKNCQFRSPFGSKGHRPDVPLTKALTLMKKVKKDTWLHRYRCVMLQHYAGYFYSPLHMLLQHNKLYKRFQQVLLHNSSYIYNINSHHVTILQ